MAVSRSFELELQSQISVDDKEWVFDVPNLPTAQQLYNGNLIKLVTLVTKGPQHSLLLRVEQAETSRAVCQRSLGEYVLVSFAEFRSLQGSSKVHLDSIKVKQPRADRERLDYKIRFLRAGIVINKTHYNFYGHSNSQLKSNTCYFWAATKDAISRRVEAMGDFTHMKTVAKKSKRIGLLFTVAKVAVEVPPDRVQDIPDIKRNDYVFTDGCGLISHNFAQEVSRRLRIVFRDRRYTPSVFQIRYRGYKGMVTVDPAMPKEYWLKLRESMKKFNGGEDLSFCIIKYSKPYTFGNMNDEIVMLLSELGIKREVFIRKQQEHLEFLSQADKNPKTAFQFLNYINEVELAEQVVLASLESVRSKIRRKARNEYLRSVKESVPKCRILVFKSRLLFGVCDSWGVLKEGQCAVKVTMDGDGQPYALKGMQVLVARNPCLHPGDLQKLEVVERPELAHLVDCIVFSTKGKRPSVDLMSGGDLDGDEFWVCWDQDLIPTTIAEAASYPGVKEQTTLRPVTDDDRLMYFARYSNISISKVKNLHLRWAKARGAMSTECQQLNRLSAQCLDGYELGTTELDRFRNPPRILDNAPPFILDELHELYKKAKTLVFDAKNIWPALEGQDLDGVELLLCRDGIVISEMELIKLAVKWCRNTCTSFELVAHCFDFNALTAEEKAWVLAQTPPTAPMPSLVLNALCSSDLVTESELKPFHLNYPGMHWKRIYSGQDRLATFLDACTRSMEIFHKKLIVFRPENRLTLAIYIPEKIIPSDDHLIDDRVRLFAFPHTQGPETQSRMSLPTKKNYKLYCDQNVFELFQGQRGDTWIHLRRGPTDDSTYRNLSRIQDQRRAKQQTLHSGANFDFRASIALGKFSSGLQKHIGREIYIISNRDVSSLRVLDLWENYVDSDQILPLFDQEPKKYTLPSLMNVDWDTEDELVVQVVKKRNFAALTAVQDTKTFISLIEWLTQKHQRGLVVECYRHLLAAARQKAVRQEILLEMLQLLKRVPYASIEFEKLGPWNELPEELGNILEEHGTSLLRGIVFSESQYGELISAPFERILENISRIRVEDFSHLMQMIAITVHSLDAALDILLGCLERQSTIILAGRLDMIQYFVRNATAVVIEYMARTQEGFQTREEPLNMRLSDDQPAENIGTTVEVDFRIDLDPVPPVNTHVRLLAASPPERSLFDGVHSMDGVVTESKPGIAKIVCYHPVPPFFQECSWKLQHCGDFERTKTMLDSLCSIAMPETKSCGIIDQILARPSASPASGASRGKKAQADDLNLNESQNSAVRAALSNAVTCILAPRWTGTVRTVTAIIHKLQLAKANRILVTAPTHRIVDHIMKGYIRSRGQEHFEQNPQHKPLRFSLDVCNVDEDLKRYTCDFLIGQGHSPAKQAHESTRHIKAARLVFATCIESGQGLVRGQTFSCVIVDGSSQLGEAESLVPLARGCKRAVLVGDHQRFQPGAHELAVPLGAHVSLFERLYLRAAAAAAAGSSAPGVAQIMLDVQHGAHPVMSGFASREFYGQRLASRVQDRDRDRDRGLELPGSAFPWPASSSSPSPQHQHQHQHQQASRMAFVHCADAEEMGLQSKANKGQARVCREICNLLRSKGSGRVQSRGLQHRQQQQPGPPSIAVLTPFARQLGFLEEVMVSGPPGVHVAMVDAFQDRSADIVIFCTVRSNASGELGGLSDGRLMNTVLGSARLGLIVVGNGATLAGGSPSAWTRLMSQLPVARLP